MRFTLFCFGLLLAISFLGLETFSQIDETSDTKEAVVSEQSSDVVEDSVDQATEEALIAISSEPVQYCQGKYNKKGIGGIEIITVQCPNVTSTCSCEVNKKTLRERVNCGETTKNPSERSELLSCDSKIIGD